jgi:hypothetical protein
MENTIRVRQAALALGIAFLVTLHIGTARQASQSVGCCHGDRLSAASTGIANVAV